MNRFLQSFILLLAMMMPIAASADIVQLADGVYQDGSTLYIGSGVTTLGSLQVNPSVIYCYATIPPACVANTYIGYGATLHVPTAAMVNYFSSQYWYNFNNVMADAVEPTSLTISHESVTIVIGDQFHISASVTPTNSTPNVVSWHSTNTSVATISGGTVTTVAPGECDIIANCATLQTVCHLTVTSSQVTITLDKHDARVLPNHMLTLKATCSPMSTNLAVMSSDNTIAMPRLINGSIQVLGLKEGTAKITVNSVDGTANPDTCVVTVYTEIGDINTDGYVNISDVTSLIDYLLNGDINGISLTNADCDKDSEVNISDVTTLIDYLLNDYWSWEIETFIVNGISFKMVSVEGGTFIMGATAEQGNGDFDEKPAHQVTLSSFLIGQTEVTQALWISVMGSNPSEFTGNLNRPVEMVSWADCQEFILKLNQMTGKHFRLPTEAEWEYAARGGNKSQGYRYSGSNSVDEVAWYKENATSVTHPVKTKKANELGLFDMSGNVCEWLQDWYGMYNDTAQFDPTGPTQGGHRVTRSGCWGSSDYYCRVSYRRLHYWPLSVYNFLGLRLVLDEDNSPKFRLSETVINVLVGESKTINILNGDSNYTMMGGSNNITSTISGNSLTVMGINEGITTVHVTNTSTGATAILTVIVINPNIIDGHEYVDLGLPSCTLWATCNVGAESPEEYGDFFAWGETSPKEVYNWSTYRWCNGNYNTLKKYCTKSNYGYNGFTDGKTELDPEDDVAYVNWGLSWRMPSMEQQRELLEQCTWTWTTMNGVIGKLCTGPNGNNLFLPAFGYFWDESLGYVGSSGFFWSRTLYPSGSDRAYYLFVGSEGADWDNGHNRCFGLTVRAVRAAKN